MEAFGVGIEYALQGAGNRVAPGISKDRNVDRRRRAAGRKKHPVREGGRGDSIEEGSIGDVLLGNLVEKIRTGDDRFTLAWVDQRREGADASCVDTVYPSDRRVQFLDEAESATRVESWAIGDRRDEDDELIRFEEGFAIGSRFVNDGIANGVEGAAVGTRLEAEQPEAEERGKEHAPEQPPKWLLENITLDPVESDRCLSG
jgi:hypothetical protein